MTEKIARRGVRVPAEYHADFLDTVLVREVVSKTLVTLSGDDPLLVVRAWMTSGEPGTSHQGFPVVDSAGVLIGVLTRRDLLDPMSDGSTPIRRMIRRPPSVIYADRTLREAADHMVSHNIGRLPVLDHPGGKLIGMITRSDLLSAHARRLRDAREAVRELPLSRLASFRSRTSGAHATKNDAVSK
jgi:CBS domain-containing protein